MLNPSISTVPYPNHREAQTLVGVPLQFTHGKFFLNIHTARDSMGYMHLKFFFFHKKLKIQNPKPSVM